MPSSDFRESKAGRLQKSRRKSYKTHGRPRWPWVMVVLIGLTVTVAFCACRDNDSPAPIGQTPGGADTSNPSSHYPDLEITNGINSNTVVKNYEGFTVGFNPSNRTSDWVGWELLKSEANGSESRTDRFWQDFDLDGCPSPDDYRRSGYDRGHLCPAADQKWSAKAMSDCFVMANMVPQNHDLNAGAWATLEEKERIWAQRDSALVIVAGPLYSSTDRTTIGNGVRVPSAFYKVLLAPYLPEPRAIGFIYPNMKATGNMLDYAVSVDQVEELTGLDFFSNLPDEIEEKVEKYFDFNIWNRR